VPGPANDPLTAGYCSVVRDGPGRPHQICIRPTRSTGLRLPAFGHDPSLRRANRGIAARKDQSQRPFRMDPVHIHAERER